MVAMRPDFAATNGAAFDDDAIRGRLGLHAQRDQAVGHDLNAIGLFHPQLLGAAQHGATFGTGSGDEQHREFIDGQRHQIFRDIDAFKLGRTHTNVRHWLAADFTLVFQGDVAAHQFENVDHTGTGRVDAYVLQHQLGAFSDAGSDQEERRRGNICRHFDARGGQLVPGLDTDGTAFDAHRVAEAAQHALGVVTGRRRLGHRGAASGVQASQQQAGFNLGTGHRHVVGHAGQALTTFDGQRRTTFRTGLDDRTHFTQRLGHAIHRAFGQRSITGQRGVERLRSQQAGEQAHGGAGVTHVQRAGRRFQAMQADAMDGHAAVVRAFDDHAHVAECLQRGQGIFAFEEAFDLGSAFSQRAQHDRTVRNGFVTGDADTSGQAATGFCQENQIGRVHSVHIGPAGQNFAEMFAGHAGAGEHAQQLMPIPSVDRIAQGVEVVAKRIQCAQHGLAVGEEDIVPHHRITAGDPREVAETASGIAENFQVLAALGQRVDQGKGQQVRQMAGGGKHLVVMLDLHRLDIRPQLAPQPFDQRQSRLITVFARSENDLVTAEQLGVGSLHPTLLGPCNGVAGHQTHCLSSKRQARRAHDIALGATDVGQHGVAKIQRSQLSKHLLHGQDRHCQLDDIGPLTGGSKVALATIDNAQLYRQATGFCIQIDPHHLPAQTTLTQSFGEGATDQAEADHHQAADLRGIGLHCSDSHADSTLASASRKRAFSLGKPMETRRKFGMR